MTTPFWKPRPKAPNEDWIAPLLRISLGVSTVGWIIYGIFALAFDDIQVISEAIQSWLVILGSMLIVAGAEMNTGATVVAVSRKWGAKKGQPLDTVAFIVSLVGSVTAGLIAFSIRQTRLGETGWRALALDVGPLIVGIAIALDFYAAGVELGLLKADYETDMEQWLEEKRTWDAAEAKGEHEVPQWTTAKIEDFRVVLGRLNGSRSALTAEKLEEELAEDFKMAPSPSTVKRWLKLAKKGDMS
jgi:hypothetical protein